MLKDASRQKFDIVMAWVIDRLGRSLSDLLDTIQHLKACGVTSGPQLTNSLLWRA
jgi:DNA invertase Pin-like site-specific DNA recombinase